MIKKKRVLIQVDLDTYIWVNYPHTLLHREFIRKIDELYGGNWCVINPSKSITLTYE